VSLVLFLFLLALLSGGFGLFVEALRWLLVVAIVLAVLSAVGWSRR
jgi:hypothetical protein